MDSAACPGQFFTIFMTVPFHTSFVQYTLVESTATPVGVFCPDVSDACVSPSSLPDLYVISGTGTCTGAAQANMAGYSPVTIGSFYFAAEYQGPSSDQ